MGDTSEPVRGIDLLEPEERLRRETDEVMRLYGEFHRRLSHQGVSGIEGLVALHQQVCRAADTVALAEIDYALASLGSLVDRLRLLGQRFVRLAEVKRALVPGEGGGDRVD